MSISNRTLGEGNHIVRHETWYALLLARVYCVIRGHKPVRFDVDDVEIASHRYCVCCWKQLDKE